MQQHNQLLHKLLSWHKQLLHQWVQNQPQ